MLERIEAQYLYTGMGMPIKGGAVVVSEGRTIAATGEAGALRHQYPHAQLRQVHTVAPPAVNAHAHLDMSLHPFEPMPYFDWIPKVAIGYAARRGLKAAQQGAQAIKASGAAAVGDIVWPGDKETMRWLLTESGLQGVAYWEVLDPNPATALATFEQLQRDIDEFRKLERPGGMRVGLSPHATYTVSSRLHALLALYAAREKLSVQIHVAEHPSEYEFFQSGTGPLTSSFIGSVQARIPGFKMRDLLGREPGPDLTPLNYLDELGVLENKPTLIHMVSVNDEDIRRVARAGANVVTCPRSNANLECGTFRFGAFAAAGIDVALGTDSIASGQTLNVLDDWRFALRLYPELDPRLLIRAAVKGGHRVLGSRVPLLRRGEAWDERYIWQEAGGVLNH